MEKINIILVLTVALGYILGFLVTRGAIVLKGWLDERSQIKMFKKEMEMFRGTIGGCIGDMVKDKNWKSCECEMPDPIRKPKKKPVKKVVKKPVKKKSSNRTRKV